MSTVGLKEMLKERRRDKDGKVLDETRSELKPIRGNLLHIEVTPTLDVVLESVLLKETMLGN